MTGVRTGRAQWTIATFIEVATYLLVQLHETPPARAVFGPDHEPFIDELGGLCGPRDGSNRLDIVQVRLVALVALAVAAGLGASACTSATGTETAGRPASARPSRSASAAPSATPPPKVYLAANGWSAASPVYEPKSVAVSADSSFYLESMTWTWSSTQAIGTGTGTVNTCQPDCVHGKHISAPIKVALSEPQHVCGHDFFTKMVITWVARNPDPTEPSTSTLASGAPLC